MPGRGKIRNTMETLSTNKLPRSSVSALKSMEKEFQQSKKIQLMQFLRDQEQLTEKLQRITFRDNRSSSVDTTNRPSSQSNPRVARLRPLSARRPDTADVLTPVKDGSDENRTDMKQLSQESTNVRITNFSRRRSSNMSTWSTRRQSSQDSDCFDYGDSIRTETACGYNRFTSFDEFDEDGEQDIDSLSITSVYSDNAGCAEDAEAESNDIFGDILGPSHINPVRTAGRRNSSTCLSKNFADALVTGLDTLTTQKPRRRQGRVEATQCVDHEPQVDGRQHGATQLARRRKTFSGLIDDLGQDNQDQHSAGMAIFKLNASTNRVYEYGENFYRRLRKDSAPAIGSGNNRQQLSVYHLPPLTSVDTSLSTKSKSSSGISACAAAKP